MDNFTKDTSLNTSLWTTSSPTLKDVSVITLGASTNAFVAPQITFSTQGMTLAGVSGGFQATGIQSVATFSPPFTVQATVSIVEAHGDPTVPAALFIGNVNLLSSYIGIQFSDTGISAVSNVAIGNPTLANQAINGTTYSFSIAVTAEGVGTVTLYNAAGTTLGSVGNIAFGSGPFYCILAQYEGDAGVVGADQALWQQVSVTGSTVTYMLPQLAFGGGWYTALYFTNTTGSPVSFTVNLFDGNGNPLSAAAIGGAFTTVNLQARETTLIAFPNSGSLVQGYVSIALPPGVAGYGVFRQSVPGIPDQEAVVPLSGATNTTSTLLFDDTNNLVTGVAVVNIGSATAVNATAYDMNGNLLGSAAIPLAPNGKTAAVLQSIIPQTAGILGSVDFTVPTGNVAALGLRFNGSAFTSIPTSDK